MAEKEGKSKGRSRFPAGMTTKGMTTKGNDNKKNDGKKNDNKGEGEGKGGRRLGGVYRNGSAMAQAGSVIS